MRLNSIFLHLTILVLSAACSQSAVQGGSFAAGGSPVTCTLFKSKELVTLPAASYWNPVSPPLPTQDNFVPTFLLPVTYYSGKNPSLWVGSNASLSGYLALWQNLPAPSAPWQAAAIYSPNFFPATTTDAVTEIESIIYPKKNGQTYVLLALSNSVVLWRQPNDISLDFYPPLQVAEFIIGPAGCNHGASSKECSLPRDVLIDDFNNDGKPDLIVTTQRLGVLSLWSDFFSISGPSNTPTATIPSGTITNSGPSHAEKIDLNGDTLQDLAVLNYIEKSVSLCTNQSNFNFKCDTTLLNKANLADKIAVGDFGGKTKNQIAISEINETSAASQISFYSITQTGSVYSLSHSYSTSVGSRAFYFITADFNHDSSPDIVVSNLGDRTFSVLQNQNGTYTQTNICDLSVQNTGAPRGLAVADFSGTGDLELAIATSDGISFWSYQK